MASVTAWCCAVRDARHSHRLEKYSFCAVRVLGWRGGAEKAEKQEGADRSGQEITLQQLHQGGAPNSFYPDQKSFYISFCPGQLFLPWSVQVILHQWSTQLLLTWSTQLILPWSAHFKIHSTLVNSFYPGQTILQLILPWSPLSTLVNSFYSGQLIRQLILPHILWLLAFNSFYPEGWFSALNSVYPQ